MNYQQELDRTLDRISESGRVPTLLLHSCCAPCSSYVLEYLAEYFDIMVYFYNHNIQPKEEYYKRLHFQKILIEKMNGTFPRPVSLLEEGYAPHIFLEATKGYEECAEGGDRCGICYGIRLEGAARMAREKGADYFATTLTLSPRKCPGKINEIGSRYQEEYGIPYLPSDFKKRGGFQRSIELTAAYGIYRQNYCGCGYGMPSQGVFQSSNNVL